MILKIMLLLAAAYVAFILLPAAFLTWRLCKHQRTEDFDANPDRMDGTAFELLKAGILRDIAFLRGLEHQEVSIRGADGVTLRGQWFPGGNRTLILAHGFRSTPLNNFGAVGRAFHEAGWSLLMIDQRGHGGSGGHPTLGAKESEDLLAWARWADRETCSQPQVLYGMSMGGAAVNLAASESWPSSVKALVSDCGYPNVYRQMIDFQQSVNLPRRILCPYMRLFIRLLFRTDVSRDGVASLAYAARPMFFIGGGADRSVPPETVRQAWAACGSVKDIWITDGAAHTLAFRAGGPYIREALFRFIDSVSD